MARSPKLPAAVFETVLLDRLDLTRHGAGPRARLYDGECFPIALSLSKSAMIAEGLSAAVHDQLQRDQEQKVKTEDRGLHDACESLQWLKLERYERRGRVSKRGASQEALLNTTTTSRPEA